jgi:PHD/YefM family antitoxin component YafN of YafNO toxin-antitoxin module
MIGLDALQSVQFVSKKGRRLAVLSADDWESLIDWLETLEDAKIAKEAFAKLKAARRAGWRKWERAKNKLT